MRPVLPALALAALAGCAGMGGPSEPPAATPAEQFELLKGLEGTWVSVEGEADENVDSPEPGTTVTYELTAGGSAVVETVFAGTPHEMVTVYTLDGADLVLTHYCVMQNQPHMVARPAIEANTVAFVCDENVGNLADEAAGHMHTGTLTIVDANSLRNVWAMTEKGKTTTTVGFDLVRR